MAEASRPFRAYGRTVEYRTNERSPAGQWRRADSHAPPRPRPASEDTRSGAARFGPGDVTETAQEIYDQPTGRNPTCELASWRHELAFAQHWRERLGLGRPEQAVAVLLKSDIPNNRHTAVGHYPQRRDLPVYLPADGALLAAVAMMEAGWEAATPAGAAPGRPQRRGWEGMVTAAWSPGQKEPLTPAENWMPNSSSR